MKRRLQQVSMKFIVLLALGGSLAVMFLLETVEIFAPPSYSLSLANVQHISADAWLVFDMEDGEVLTAYHEHEVLPLASLTKLATAEAVYHSDDLFSTTTITWQDVAAEGRAGSLITGEVYTKHTLLFPLLLESSNDAAAALARSDTDLLTRMNAHASSTNTRLRFADTAGLGVGNVGSAMDVRTLLREVYGNSRHVFDITGLNQYLSPTKGWVNNSPWRLDPDYRGGKQGYLPESGYTAAVVFDEPLRGGATRRLGYVLLGSQNLSYDMSLLRDYVRQHVRFE